MTSLSELIPVRDSFASTCVMPHVVMFKHGQVSVI